MTKTQKMQTVSQDTPFCTYCYTVYNMNGDALYEVNYSQIHQAQVKIEITEE